MKASKRLQRGRQGVAFVDRDLARDALDHLRVARNLLVDVGAAKAANKVRRALRSAEGACRHIDGLHARIYPPSHPMWRAYRPRPRLLLLERTAAAKAIRLLTETDIDQLAAVIAQVMFPDLSDRGALIESIDRAIRSEMAAEMGKRFDDVTKTA